MQANASRLAAGLAKIRAPGCFPHGVYVVAAGYYRTGSTLLFNTARLWSLLGAGSSLVAGWQCFPRDALGLNDGSNGKPRRSVVCKLHEISPDVARGADVVLMSHRSPWGSLCSRKMEGQWCKKQDGLKPNSPEYKSAVASCMTADDQLIPTELQCRILMGLQADVYGHVEDVGRKIGYDVPLEGWHDDPHTHISGVARAIGICEAAATDQSLIDLVHAMGTHLEAKSGDETRLTKMHTVHHDEERERVCSKIQSAIDRIPRCAAWAAADGDQASNGILSRLRQCMAGNKGKKVMSYLHGHWFERENFDLVDLQRMAGCPNVTITT